MAHRQPLRPLARRAFPVFLAVLATGVSAAGCDAADAPSGGDAAAPDAQADGTTDAPDAADAGAPEAPAVRRCFPPAGISGTPASIAEAVRLVNALPRPVTVECFLESLDRPLYAVATQSTISLQPAVGSRSPRIFLITSKLIMSIVPDGKGSQLVEFGQFVDERRTLKGEIHFPVVSDVLPAEPFERIKS
jgi:hypothetical protein